MSGPAHILDPLLQGDYEVGDFTLSELFKHWVSFYSLCLLLIIVISNILNIH